MEMKNRDIILELLHDMEDFAKLKNLDCPPLFLLGGSGCIVGGYINRTTTDIDLLDIGFSASAGRVLKLLGEFDSLDLYVTTVSSGYEKRSIKLEEFKYANVYVLSKEDIVVTKIGRYSEKDIEDIQKLIMYCDMNLLFELIENVLKRNDISKKIQDEFRKNVLTFKEDFCV